MNQNLRPFDTLPPEEHRELSRRGGVASGESRRRKAALRAYLVDALEKSYLAGEVLEEYDKAIAMLATRTAGKTCGYFRSAVLPLNPALEARLTYHEPLAKRACALCGDEYVPKNNRQQYCSGKCLKNVQRNQARERKRKQREMAG